jgi:hypothetical protein
VTTIPPSVAEVLASVCGFHGTDPCGHCADAYDHRRNHWGWPDEQVAADAILYRDHHTVWLEQAYAAYAAKQRERGANR